MAKKCPPGKYYCFDDKKCKKIPRGYHIGARGYLARDTKDDDNETKKNGNGNSNGNGNGGNGAGNGNGGSGGGANGNGGGMGEEVVYEKTMTPSQKRKDTMLKKKYDKSDMKKSMQKQYGKEEGKKVYFATIRKQAMEEGRLASLEKASVLSMSDDPKDQDKAREIKTRFDYRSLRKQIADKKKSDTKESVEGVEDDKYNVSEEGLRDWFGKSSGTTKSGRKVRGWVQVGGKYDGKPCARQPGQKSTPKCVSSSKRRSMSKSERDSAARRKRAADPNQPQKSGAAKPTNVSTDPKRKMKENYFNRNKVVEGFKGYADLSHMQTPKQKKKAEERLKKFTANTYREMKKKDKIKIGESKNPRKNKNDRRKEDLAIERQLGLPKRTDGSHLPQQFRSESKQHIDEAKDKKGKGSGTKDACYHKVKSRYSVWPSAYASGALVKCRKVGAANWGNKSKNEGFSPMQVAALEAAGMIEIKEGQKCWKGYEKKGTKKMFGKTYNNCVKKEEVEFQEGSYEDFEKKSGVKAVKPKKEVELPKTPEKKPENTYSSGNPVGKENVKRKMINVSPGSKREVASRGILGKIKHVVTGEEYAPVTEGITFKRGKKKSKSKYVGEYDAGRAAKRVMAKKDQETVNFLEPAYESKTRLVKNGHTYKVILTWRGKTYMVQMFVPSVSRPTRLQIEKEVQKLYPDAKVMSFLPRDLEPGEPTVMMGEGKNLDFMKQYKQKEKEQKMKKEVKKNLETYEGDEQHNTRMGEEYVAEDDMKGMSVKSGHKRPTKSGAGMTAKGVAAYRRRNPGSKLQTAVTGKVKKGSKDAKRRKSYCARSAGQMKKFPKAAKDPNSRLRQARRRWKC